MTKDSVKSHVDNTILKKLEEMSYDQVREHLFSTSSKFRDVVATYVDLSKFTFDELSIDGLEPSRARYLGFYILYANKRVIDLYSVERNYKKLGFSSVKNFKLLLFKEKLETTRWLSHPYHGQKDL